MTQETQRNSSESFLRLDGVTRQYGDFIALHPTTINIKEGEFFSLLGPSGCGKTTTLRIIAGFEVPDKGTVSLSGKNITHMPPNHRDTNTVFQSYALFPHMTVSENVAYPLKMRGITGTKSSQRVSEAISQVSMSNFSNRLPHQLSGGQRQRIALARAIVGRPQVLLLDEPLGALDLKLREQMQHVLVDLQQQLGITFIYVTHDQSEALSMSDRIAIINEGKIQQLASPKEIYYRPSNAFVAGFIGKSNIIDTLKSDGNIGYGLSLGGQSFELKQTAKNDKYTKAALRFEAISVGNAANDCDVSFCAEVQDALFLGNVTETTLKVGQQNLTALISSSFEGNLKKGQKIQAGFHSENLVMLEG